jgi:hypothetical protein
MMDIKIMDDRIIEQKPTPDPGKKHSKKLAGRSPKKRSRRKSDRYGKRSIFNKGKINRRPILSLLLGLGVLSAILLVTMLTASKTPKSLPKIYSNLQGSETESVATTPMPTGEEVLGVLTEVDPIR